MAKEGTSKQQLVQKIDALRESEEKLQALLHALPIGVSILGKDRLPIYTNPALGKVLGLSDDKLYKGEYGPRKYLRADGSEMPADEFPSARAFSEQQAVKNVEVGIVKENGETIWAMVNAVPFERGKWRLLMT